MQISEYTFRLFLIFLPGIISYSIIITLTVHEKITPFKMLINSFIYGFICYLLYYTITLLLNIQFSFFKYLVDTSCDLNFDEILIVTACSVPVGLGITALISHKVLFKIAHFFRISHKFGNPGVWSYLMNLEPKKLDAQWVNIIDRENKLLYHGFIQIFSDNKEQEDELFLRNVTVYRYQNDKVEGKLFYVTGMYLNKKRKNMVVEFPNMPYLEMESLTKGKKPKKNKIKST